LAKTVQKNQLTVQQDKQETKASIKALENQMAKLDVSINKLEANHGRLPAQAENPRENVCAINLRSGRELLGVEPKLKPTEQQSVEQHEQPEVESNPQNKNKDDEPYCRPKKENQ
jgi:hypothetical protein